MDIKQELTEKLYLMARRFIVTNGESRTPIDYIAVHCYKNGSITLPSCSVPYLYLVLSGSIRLYYGTDIFESHAGEFFLSAIDTPFKGEVTNSSSGAPFIALTITLNADEIISVMLELDDEFLQELFLRDVDPSLNLFRLESSRLKKVILRLLELDGCVRNSIFMQKHLKRELIFDLITGAAGKKFVSHAINIQQAGKIYDINSWIKRNYRGDFSIEDLAKQANMSVSSFHQKFKSSVGMGPLQCQKKLRLIEARRLMLNQELNVSAAAMEVGYENLSQFIRDYRRMFGLPPQKDIQGIRELLQSPVSSKVES